MRTDKSLDQSFVESDHWDRDPVTGNAGGAVDRYQLPRDRKSRLSLSGNERNHLFLKDHEGKFVDVSGISGLDLPHDGRVISIVDFDRDGWQEFLLTNTSDQTLRLFHNQIGRAVPDHQFIAIRLIGGNRQNASSDKFSSRDAVGTHVTVVTGQQQVVRELHCGEGLAAQNSRTLLIGLGRQAVAKSVEAVFPSGIAQRIADVPAGSLVTLYENNEETADGSGVTIESWRVTAVLQPVRNEAAPAFPLEHSAPDAKLVVYTGMATWCAACRKYLIDFQRICEEFGDEVAILGLPIDATDDANKLQQYLEQQQPCYELLELDGQGRFEIKRFVEEQAGITGVPFSLIVSPDNEVLEVLKGAPTVSQVRAVMAQLANSN